MPSNCRGCKRWSMSDAGSFYQFVSDPGWEPARLIIDTDALMLLAIARPYNYLPIDTPALKEIVDNHEMFDEHIDHVNHTLPIVLGECTFTEAATGSKEVFHLCPDGHHRVAKCLKLGIPVPFCLFSEDEMKAHSYTSVKEYMHSKGVFVFGVSDEEMESVLWE